MIHGGGCECASGSQRHPELEAQVKNYEAGMIFNEARTGRSELFCEAHTQSTSPRRTACDDYDRVADDYSESLRGKRRGCTM